MCVNQLVQRGVEDQPTMAEAGDTRLVFLMKMYLTLIVPRCVGVSKAPLVQLENEKLFGLKSTGYRDGIKRKETR